MSVDATRWAWQQDLKSTRKIVLLSLADRADEQNRCYPSIVRLVADTGVNRKTIMRAISDMENMGLIESEKALGKSNVYTLIGVENRHEKQSQKWYQSQNRHQSQNRDSTSPKIGTRTSPKIGTDQSQNRDTEPNNNLTIEPNKNLTKGNKVELPDWIDADLWVLFIATRKEKKYTTNESWKKSILSQLGKARKNGHDVNDMIETSIANGWRGVVFDQHKVPVGGSARKDRVQRDGFENNHYSEVF